MKYNAIELGKPESIPGVIIEPINDPVPREVPKETPEPVKKPERKPVPA